ncbi:reverse transcriptase domain-containing protein [Tanacetum coccineum]
MHCTDPGDGGSVGRTSCSPGTGFEIQMIDTFYNNLNQSDQDSLNSAAGGNFLTKNTRKALTIIENKSKVQTSRNKPQVSSASGSSTQDAAITALTKQVAALVSSMNQPINLIQNDLLKDLLKDKEKLAELANTLINAKCSAILLNKVPENLDDPRQFLIPCVLQDLEVCNSLADSEESINLMPLSIYKKLRIEPLNPTQMTLELANRSVTFLMGIAEDVIVKVQKFNFLADFVIVDFETDPIVPIILGRPFLRTTRALVDLYEEKITLRVGNEEVVFYTDKSSRNNSRDIHSVHCINIIDFSKDKQSSGNTTSHFDDFLPDYEAFCFDIEEKSSKSSGNTISHSDLSLLEYESFYFDLSNDSFPPANMSDSPLEEFADELAHIISPPEYDRFYFDIEPDLGELTRCLEEIISKDSTKELTSPKLNDLRLLLSDCDSVFSENFSEIDLLVLFPSGNKDKVFDPGIFTIDGVHSKRFSILLLDDFSSILFVRDCLFLTGPS